jgi:hypothetical protein
VLLVVRLGGAALSFLDFVVEDVDVADFAEVDADDEEAFNDFRSCLTDLVLIFNGFNADNKELLAGRSFDFLLEEIDVVDMMSSGVLCSAFTEHSASDKAADKEDAPAVSDDGVSFSNEGTSFRAADDVGALLSRLSDSG